MSNFKKLVETRMAKTGETWSTAAHEVRAQVSPPPTLVLIARRADYDLPTKFGELDGSGFTRASSRAVLSLTATNQLIQLLGAGYGDRPFDLVWKGEMFIMCWIRKVGTSIRVASNVDGNRISGGCTFEFDRVIGATLRPDDAMPDDEILSLETVLSSFSADDLRIANHRLNRHPLRGPEASRVAYTAHGTVVDGHPVAGVRIYSHGDEYRVRATEVSGTLWSYTELAMTPSSLRGYRAAILDVLGVGRSK